LTIQQLVFMPLSESFSPLSSIEVRWKSEIPRYLQLQSHHERVLNSILPISEKILVTANKGTVQNVQTSVSTLSSHSRPVASRRPDFCSRPPDFLQVLVVSKQKIRLFSPSQRQHCFGRLGLLGNETCQFFCNNCHRCHFQSIVRSRVTRKWTLDKLLVVAACMKLAPFGLCRARDTSVLHRHLASPGEPSCGQVNLRSTDAKC